MPTAALSQRLLDLLNAAKGNPAGPWASLTQDVALGTRLNELAALLAGGGMSILTLADVLGLIDATDGEAAFAELAMGPSKVNVEVLAGSKTILLSTALIANARIQILDPANVTRPVLLPAETSRLWYWVKNSGTESNDLINVQNDAGGLIIQLKAGESALVASSATAWAVVSATGALGTPLTFQGVLTVAANFPTLLAVKKGDYYRIAADVTDNDAAKTNTGGVFIAGSEIAWTGAAWADFGAIGTADVAAVDTGTDGVRAVTPLSLAGSALKASIGILFPGVEGFNFGNSPFGTPLVVAPTTRLAIVNTNGGNVEIELQPVGAAPARELLVLVVDASNNFTLTPNAADNIDGAGVGVGVNWNTSITPAMRLVKETGAGPGTLHFEQSADEANNTANSAMGSANNANMLAFAALNGSETIGGAAIADATAPGKIQTVAPCGFRVFGQTGFTLAPADPFWDLSAFGVSGADFQAFGLDVTSGGVAEIVTGPGGAPSERQAIEFTSPPASGSSRLGYFVAATACIFANALGAQGAYYNGYAVSLP